MALHEIALSHNAIDVAVSGRELSGPSILIAVLHANGVSFYDWVLKAKPDTPPTLTRHVSISSRETQSGTQNQQICWTNNNCVFVLQSHSHGSFLHKVPVENDDRYGPKQSFACKIIKRILTSTSVRGRQDMCLLLETHQVMVQGLERTDVVGDDGVPGNSVASFTVPTPWTDVVELPGGEDYAGYDKHMKSSTYIAFGLSDNGSLYANERLLSRNCTSFLVTLSHLIFTTTQNLLKFVHMTDVHGTKIEIQALHVSLTL